MILPPESHSHVQSGTVAILGLPSDENSSFIRGPALAPARIREVLHRGGTNLNTEQGIDLALEPRLLDLGDLRFSDSLPVMEQIEVGVAEVLSRGANLLALGGDHAVTYPVVKAFSQRYANLNILLLDAHPDIYDIYKGDPFSHGSPFARIMEAGLAKRLVQVGVRTLNTHQRAQIERFGVEVILMKDWVLDMKFDFAGPVYLSLDLDVLDPAFVPGVSHQEPGGPSTREVLHLLHSLKIQLVGADIVEYNPLRDPAWTTAMTAVKFLKEIAALMLLANQD